MMSFASKYWSEAFIQKNKQIEMCMSQNVNFNEAVKNKYVKTQNHKTWTMESDLKHKQWNQVPELPFYTQTRKIMLPLTSLPLFAQQLPTKTEKKGGGDSGLVGITESGRDCMAQFLYLLFLLVGLNNCRPSAFNVNFKHLSGCRSQTVLDQILGPHQ